MKWLTPSQRGRVEAWLESGYIPRGQYGSDHRLIVAIAFESGLRESEVLMLRHGQANVTSNHWEGVLRLKRKDRARLDAALGPRTKEIYLDMFPDMMPEEQELFPNGPTANAVYKFFRRLGDDLQIEGFNPHRLRHTLGRDMAKDGATPAEIQLALGHQSGTTSLIYYQSTAEEAITAALRVRGGVR